MNLHDALPEQWEEQSCDPKAMKERRIPAKTVKPKQSNTGKENNNFTCDYCDRFFAVLVLLQ